MKTYQYETYKVVVIHIPTNQTIERYASEKLINHYQASKKYRLVSVDWNDKRIEGEKPFAI